MNITNFTIPPPLSNAPTLACVCPAILQEMSCWNWKSKIGLSVISGGIFGVVLTTTLLVLLRKQYKFKKIITFANPIESAQETV